MKKRNLIAGALALALLAGCSGGGSKTLTADPDDLAYQAADIRRDADIFTVDGVGVKAEEYLFWLVNAIAEQEYYGAISGDEGWDSTTSDGTPMAQALKEDAQQAAVLYQVVRNKAAELGVSITDEQKAQLEVDLSAAQTEMGGAEEYLLWLESYCISEAGFVELNQVGYLHQNIQEKLQEQGALDVTEEDLDAFMEENGIYAAKHILIATRRIGEDGVSYEEFTDEEKAQALQEANDLREQLRKAGDSEDLFDTLMNERSDDGRDGDGNLYYPQGYDFVYAGQMVSQFEEGALALSVGEISEPIETTYGYHIILRTAPNLETVRDYCDEDYKLNALLQEWLDSAQVVTTKAYDELDPHDFYTRLQTVTEAREIARKLQQNNAGTESEAPEDETQESAQPEG